MEIRVKTLEEKVESLVTDVAVIKSNYATKEDISTIRVELAGTNVRIADVKAELHSMLRTQVTTIVGSMIAITGVASGVIIKFLAH
ncbi:hemolysin XhlA [Pseudescherichia sp.]|uniref:hemolysin XhlA n=1 Tax=Pseudescherichia sp. TaxID=2055881 RepID=UPI0028B14431|nr:hemolysin XhlA [Pseudescherichia sp.]